MSDPRADAASDEPLVLALSRRQLAAYNRGDIDAFCACFHGEVTVLDAQGARSIEGIDAFRARYGAMFASHREVAATVSERIVLGPHCVERERWSRVSRDTGARTEGEVIVRYTEHEGRLRWVEFLREG
jgi:hypothetical protein